MKMKNLLLGLILFCFSGLTLADGSQTLSPVDVNPQVLNPVNTAPIVTDSDYSKIAKCPAQITNCPGIDGTGGDPNTCPDNCTVTRSPEMIDPNNLPPATRIYEATCPTNYNQVANYNTQDEAKFTTDVASVFPHSMDEYRRYMSPTFNYTCAAIQPVVTTHEYYCSSAPFHYGDMSDSAEGLADRVVVIGDPSTGQASYRSSCHCKGSCLPCDCAIASDPNWTYYARFVSCKPPNGVYATGRRVPVSLVCSRLRSNWEGIKK